MPRNPVRWGLGLVGLGEQVGPRREAPCGGLLRSRSLPAVAQHGMGAEGPLQHPVRGSLPSPYARLTNACRPLAFPPRKLGGARGNFCSEVWQARPELPASSEIKLKMGCHRCQVARGHLPLFFLKFF